ncbi:hypothetical protein BRYFOR_07808 [Marvinbryantia formatexigens DSM 14469]|uniref:Uncharacterized protein n=1 Tax=Marvinbryantia formatexigens DSM 14469 TaxID=478749 RepID=C6LGP8_9FIRM|nr:hypothetical protein BRYFOR_07808 [Marvinbryantia formatexigens DSM 14469]
MTFFSHFSLEYALFHTFYKISEEEIMYTTISGKIRPEFLKKIFYRLL